MATTSWVTKDGHAFSDRHGRIQIIECEEIKFLCKEHLQFDVLISLPKPPPSADNGEPAIRACHAEITFHP